MKKLTAMCLVFALCLPALAQTNVKSSVTRQLSGATEAQRKGKIAENWREFPAEDGTQVRLYVAHPDLKYAGEVPNMPALLIIQEWWGVNEDIQARTRDFAQRGYYSVAVDLYDGKATADPKEAAALKSALTDSAALLRLKTGVDFIHTQVDRGIVNGDKLAAIGWCMGGTQALNLAIADPRIHALVIFYGGDIVTDTDKLKDIRGPVLGVFGNDDKNPSPDRVNIWEKALKDSGKDVTILRYDGAGHAFASDAAKPLGMYRPTQAADAWAKTWSWLEKTMK